MTQRVSNGFWIKHSLANNYPKGPVQLSIPTNFVLPEKWNRSRMKMQEHLTNSGNVQAPPRLEDIKQIEEMLAHSAKPVIISGGGVWYSEADKMLESFAADNNIRFSHHLHI